MNAVSSAIIAGAVLWLGTMIGAWQLGRHHGGAPVDADLPHPDTNTRMASAARGGPHPDEPLSVSRFFARPDSGFSFPSKEIARATAWLETLTPEQLQDALAEAEHLDNRNAKSEALAAIIAVWAERDGPAAMKFASERAANLGNLGSKLTWSAALSWADHDPDAVWTWYQGVAADHAPIFPIRAELLDSVFFRMVKRDPDTAFRRLDELAESDWIPALKGMTKAALRDDAMRHELAARISRMGLDEAPLQPLKTAE